MRCTLALTIVVGMVVGGLGQAGLSIAPTPIHAQETSSSSPRIVPRLTDAEFQRLYDRVTGIWDFQPDKSSSTQAEGRGRTYVIYGPDGDKAIKYTNRSLDDDGQVVTTVSRQVLGPDYSKMDDDRMISRLPLDEFTVESTIKNGGTLLSRNIQFFSLDGQRMIISHKGVTDGVEHITSISVWDKIDTMEW